MQKKTVPNSKKSFLVLTMLAVVSQLTACGGGSADSGTGGSTVSTDPKITQFSPLNPYLNFNTSFTAEGINLPTLTLQQVTVANCADLKLSHQTKTAFQFTCKPSSLGLQPVKIVDAQGTTLYAGNINVQPYPDAEVDRVEPLTAIVGQNQTFNFFGRNLDRNGVVIVDDHFCREPKVLARTKEILTFSCTPQTLTDFSLSIKNRLRQQVFSATVSVRKPTPVVTSVEPKLLALNQISLFLIDGLFLNSGIKVEIENCTNLQSRGSTKPSAHVVSCKPTQLGATKLKIIDPATDRLIWSDTLTVIDRPVRSVPLTLTGFTKCSTGEIDNSNDQPVACTAEALGAAAGFGQDGELKIGQPVRYEELSNGCIKDQNTGLTWEKKTNNGGLNDQKWTYIWYNSNPLLNGDFAGYMKAPRSAGVTCHSSLENCNTEAYIQKLNETKYCGYQNWRMPNLDELRSLQVFDTPRDSHPNRIFYAANATNHAAWSASSSTFSSVNDIRQYRAWSVDLLGDHSDITGKTGLLGVIAVRAEDTQANQLAHYSLPNSGTSICNIQSLNPDYNYQNVVGSGGTEVIDLKTNLIWQRCAIGQTWDGTTCLGQAKSMTWLQGLKAAQALGSGYRMPNLRELLSIHEANCSEPSINENIFPNTAIDQFYMSSSRGRSVQFLYGWLNVRNNGYVRAVRTAP